MAFQTFTHEGLKIRFDKPGTPKALLAAFHGRGGSSNGVITDAQWLEFLTAALAAGYAIVVPESKNRLLKKWDTDVPPNNGDIPNMGEIIARLRSEFGLSPGLPVVGIGHSNGGKFSACYGHYTALASVALVHSGAEGDSVGGLLASHDYQTPSIFTYGQNDTTAPYNEVNANFVAVNSRGVLSELHEDPGSDHPFSAANKTEIIAFFDTSL